MTTREALERLAKWRSVFAGWQLGTRVRDDPESQAVRDHREATLILRAEVSALVRLLIEKKVITLADFDAILKDEALILSDSLAERFPGIKATDQGITYDRRAAETMKGWLP
jgi:hypothetical protein